jgi:DNA-binding PadR family transcriptional regulator
MPRKQGSIGKTKLMMLAIIYHLEKKRESPYGYAIWQILKRVFKSHLKPMDVRNVYHHLQDLTRMEYIEKREAQVVKGVPDRQLYALTRKGRKFTEDKCRSHLELLEKMETKQ